MTEATPAVPPPAPAPVEQQPIPPPTAAEFGRVIFEQPKGRIQKDILDNVTANRNLNVLAGKAAISEQAILDTVDALYGGEKPTDKNLARSHKELADRLIEIQKICSKPYESLSAPQQKVLRIALEMRIKRTPGLSNLFYELINEGNSRDGMLDLLLKRGAMQEIANGKLMDALVFSEETSNLRSIRDEVNRLETRQAQVKKQLDALPKSTGRTTAELQNSKVTALEDDISRLQDRLRELPDEIGEAEDRLESRELYLQNQGMSQGQIDADPRVKRFTREINALKKEKTTATSDLKDAKKRLTDERKKGDQVGARGTLQAEYDQIIQQLSEKRALEGPARVAALKRANELYKSLVDILPEASKQFVEELKIEVGEGNKERVRKDEEKKAKDAKEKNDIFAQAEAELTAQLTQRYLERYTTSFLGTGWRPSERYRPDISRLRDEFRRLLEPGGSSRLTEHILRNQPGLSKNVIDYLNNPRNADARREFILKMRAKVYSAVASDAVQYLHLDKVTMQTIAQSEEFCTAAESAFARDARVKAIAEKAAQQKLDDKGSIRRLWAMLPAGGLAGILMLIFGIFGGGLFKAGK